LRVYEHHFFVKDYFIEYKGFDRINELFNPQWATHNLYLTAEEEADGLYRYLEYLIGMGCSRGGKVLLKFNRISFRLPWLRARFPQAKIVHIYRNPEGQWRSMVRRGQEHAGREDIGQDRPDFEGFNIASSCEDLKSVFPELTAGHSNTGFERFLKLYERSLAAHRACADVSLEYKELCADFETQCRRMFQVVGCTADIAPLKHLIVPPETQQRLPIRPHGIATRAANLVDRLGRRYAKTRLHLAARYHPRLTLKD
jgi:hypothetical protein